MSSLRVKNWQDWEDICKYLMSYLVKEKMGVNVTYTNYGSPGQNQHGVDLIPIELSAPAVVAQCKHVLGNLTWKTIEDELKKTDTYPNTISHYIVLTTGNRDTSVQNALNNGGGVYTRPNEQQIKVHVLYFDQFDVQNIIPINMLQRFFPDIFKEVQQSSFMSSSNSDYIESLTVLRNYIPQVLTMVELNWLECWPFSKGFVVEQHYNKFYDLYIEYHRTINALDGIQDWLNQGHRVNIAKSLPAGEKFYYALGLFVNSVSNHIIGRTLDDGTSILWIGDLPSAEQPKIASQWQSNANYLAQTYRQLILGESTDM
ncbi:hypothetical protein [Vibrio cincinnatiensis]|uniref:hypothetical protein n=1 Tax=Vibrio cincinnatiensis TaxID=675 RepID=UPI001EDE7B5C|nr:hypothetical protein [Vibrio cincinnatiensis]MCG3724104.1 hypothetical protein [Vibrio cincinnatiensis]